LKQKKSEKGGIAEIKFAIKIMYFTIIKGYLQIQDMFKNSLFKKVQVICLSNVTGQVIKELRHTVGKRSLPCF